MKSNANPEVIDELRAWQFNSITLEWELLKAVLDDLQRKEIDVLVKLEFDRKCGSSATAAKRFRLICLLDEDSGEYHLHLMNLPQNKYSAPDIA